MFAITLTKIRSAISGVRLYSLCLYSLCYSSYVLLYCGK